MEEKHAHAIRLVLELSKSHPLLKRVSKASLTRVLCEWETEHPPLTDYQLGEIVNSVRHAARKKTHEAEEWVVRQKQLFDTFADWRRDYPEVCMFWRRRPLSGQVICGDWVVECRFVPFGKIRFEVSESAPTSIQDLVRERAAGHSLDDVPTTMMALAAGIRSVSVPTAPLLSY